MQTEIYLPLSDNAIVQNAPETSGVYVLYNEKREVIFFGKAQKQTLREKLLQHLNSSSDCLRNAHYFSVEMSRRPDRRLEQHLRQFVSVHGKQPECNERLEQSASRPIEALCSSGVLTNAFLR